MLEAIYLSGASVQFISFVLVGVLGGLVIARCASEFRESCDLPTNQNLCIKVLELKKGIVMVAQRRGYLPARPSLRHRRHL